MPAQSFRAVSLLDPVADLVLAFQEAWRHGPPPLERFRARLDAEESSYGLAELVKADLQQRYRRGERPSAREYFDRFPILTAEDGHALSLIYEEFCLRDEANEGVDPSDFCDRYDTWRHSLVSQLAYHRELSRAVEPLPTGPDLPEAGDRFGDYQLVRMLGQGGAARVFLARAISLGGKEVVLKISLDRGGESAVLGKLDHDHIVAVFTTIVDPETGLRGLCMPYRPGLPLDDILRRFRRDAIPRTASALEQVVDRAFPDLPIEEGRRPGWADLPASRSYADGVAWMGMKLAGALAHAHGLGVLHRDVKPENILLSRRDGPQLLDFNLAHDSTVADQARAAHRGGTLPYMAREHLQAFLDPTQWAHVGAPADLFSLGLILREMLTLRPVEKPAENVKLTRSINDLIQKRAAPQVPIRRFNRRVPHALEAIVAKCLAEFPEDRYQSANDLADDLGCFLNRRDLKVARNPSIFEVIGNRVRRKARVAGVAVSIALVVWLIVSISRPPPPVEMLSMSLRAAPGTDFIRRRKPIPWSEKIVEQTATPATLELIESAWAAREQKNIAVSNDLFQKALNRSDAINALRVECQHHEHSLALHMALARALFDAYRYEEAESVYSHATVLDPSSSSAVHGCASAELCLGKYEAALVSINRAMRLFPDVVSPEMKFEKISIQINRSRILLGLGDVAKDNRKFDSARDYFTQAIADLVDIGKKPEVKTLPSVAFAYHFLFAVAEASLGDTAFHLNDFQVSSHSYQAAFDHVKAARKTGAGDKERIDGLESDIKKQQREGIAG